MMNSKVRKTGKNEFRGRSVFIMVFMLGMLSISGQKAGAQETSTLQTTMSLNQTSGSSSARGSAESTSYVSTLNSDDLLMMGEGTRTHFFYGSSFSGIYDDRIGDTTERIKGGLFVVSPNIGIASQTDNAHFVFQYGGSVTGYTNRDLGTRFFQSASFRADGDFNARWGWNLATSAGFGDDDLRLLGPLQFNAVGSVPVADPSSLAFELGTQRVFGSEGSLGFQWRRNSRQRVGFSFLHSYHRFFQAGEDSNVGTFRITFDHDISRKATFRIFAQAHRAFDRFVCSSYGGGIGVILNPNSRTTMELSFGPQINTPARCGKQQAVNFHWALSSWLTRSTRGYVSADREFSTTFLARSRWQDSVVAGLNQNLGRRTDVGFDLGYLRTDRVDESSLYQGYLASGHFRLRLARPLSLTASYRWFYREIGDLILNRNLAMLTLRWSPRPVGIFR